MILLSNYYHRYSVVRQRFVHEHGDFPGPEMENDIEINILHHKRHSLRHYHEYPTKYSPIEFDHKNLKLPIEKENILDESQNEEFEEVKVVNNIVYLED